MPMRHLALVCGDGISFEGIGVTSRSENGHLPSVLYEYAALNGGVIDHHYHSPHSKETHTGGS